MPAIPPPYTQIRQPDLVQPQAIGMAGASLRELAQTSAQVGQAMVQMKIQQQEANDTTWLSEATARAEKDLITQFDDFTKTNAEKPENTAELFQKQTNDLFGQIATEAPSARARMAFQRQAQNMSGQAFDNAFKWQNTQMAKNFANRLDNVQADLATVAMRTQDPGKLADLYKQVDAATVAGSTFIDPGELEKLNRNMKASVAQGFLEKSVSTNPGSTMRLIDSKQFDGILDPDKQMAYRRSAHAEIKRQEAEARQRQYMERASAMEDVKGALEALQNGQAVDVSQINFGALPDNKRDLYRQAVADAQEFSGVYNQVRFDSPADMMSAINAEREKLTTTPPGEYRQASKQLGMLERAAAQRTQQLNSDPFSYVSQAPAVQELADQLAAAPAEQQPALQQRFNATMAAEQRRLGVPYQNVSLLPKVQAEALVSTLSGPTTSDQVVGTIQTLQRQYGEYYPYVQQQLAKAGLPTHLEVVAARAPAKPIVGQKLLQAVENQKALKEMVPTATENEIQSTINQAMQPLAQTLRQNPNGTTKLGSYASTAKLLAMQYVADGADASDAATRAANEVVLDEYTFENTYRVPSRLAAYQGDIRTAANRLMADTIKRNQFDVPKVGTQGMDMEVARRLSAEDLRGQAYWITTADDQGLMLYHPQRGPVTYQRQPITVSFDDLARMQEDERKKQQERIDRLRERNPLGIMG
ncbi:hypothetical protein UFOVP315_7 [uncultured Caudovirales phage]|uniref:Uncharacterized protein n=1 Tax=uncultured Caudovirales phage TaxID=2100421 RepID=A0A6J5LV95_9CAUD|nr:hypothetical protein UFOVP315_7 [uncultured Caudovirales phage]